MGNDILGGRYRSLLGLYYSTGKHVLSSTIGFGDMAQNESDSEDLMAEATALKRRIELRCPGEKQNVIAGFRDDGRLSIYFGHDPVYHVDEWGCLRRAFVDGRLYRSHGTTLARLTRVRTREQTELQRYDLSDEELEQFRQVACERLERFRQMLADGRAERVAQVPADETSLPAGLEQQIGVILEGNMQLAPAIRAGR